MSKSTPKSETFRPRTWRCIVFTFVSHHFLSPEPVNFWCKWWGTRGGGDPNKCSSPPPSPLYVCLRYNCPSGGNRSSERLRASPPISALNSKSSNCKQVFITRDGAWSSMCPTHELVFEFRVGSTLRKQGKYHIGNITCTFLTFGKKKAHQWSKQQEVGVSLCTVEPV